MVLGVEVVLVAAGMLGVLVSVLFSAQRTEEMTATQKVGHAIINLIQRDIEALYLPANAKEKGNERQYFAIVDNGQFDRIDFITAVQSMPNEENRRCPIAEVGYVTVDHTQSTEALFILFRREDVFEDDGEPLAGGRFLEVYDRNDSFRERAQAIAAERN